MPIDYKKYPKNWKSEIRPSILKRANNKCEICGIDNYAEGYRDKQGNFYRWQEIEDALDKRGYDYFDNELAHCLKKDGTAKNMTKIVLTIAHLDHDISHNDVTNLMALCQRCHLNHDNAYHIANRKAKKEAKLGNLFV